MSDTQDRLILQQRQMQQRQILAMMGIEQWIQPDSPTINLADISLEAADQPVSSDSSGLSELSDLSVEQPSFDSAESTLEPSSAIAGYDTANIVSNNLSDEQSPVTHRFDSLTTDAPNVANTDIVTQVAASSTINTAIKPLMESVTAAIPENNNSIRKVAPFDLQGGRYGNWVLMVDIQALNNDSQKLWQNIIQALSISCETASFPICAGMDTAELANASLAGYVFKIGRSEEVLVAALTELPEGLIHPNLASVPTLNEMLADSSLKRDLWEQLSDQV